MSPDHYVPNTTTRTARKSHPCQRCWWETQRDAGFPGQRVPMRDGGRIQPGEQYVECYEYGEDAFHPARYHLACWEREALA